jgi:PAS domain S-box-containing protein
VSDPDAEAVERYELLLQTLAEGIVLTDTDGKTVAANPAAERILHRPEDQLRGTGAGDPHFEYVHEDGSAFSEEDLPGRITRLTGEPCNDVVIGIAAIGEPVHWVSMTTRAIRAERQAPPFQVVVSMVDVTERLESAERNRALVAELERSNAELEQFASILAHDLAAPLRVIRGFADVLTARAGERLEPDERAHLGRIVSQAQVMQAMIDALREYARVGGGSLVRAEVDTGQLVAGVLERLEPLVVEREAEISVGELPKVHAHATQLGQVFQNLLDNALTHAGREKPTIRVWAEEGSDGVTFAVADNGEGVPTARRTRMFDMFTRGSDGDGTEGMGVGLAICRRIVERHGGRIWIEDADPGARIRFTLP